MSDTEGLVFLKVVVPGCLWLEDNKTMSMKTLFKFLLTAAVTFSSVVATEAASIRHMRAEKSDSTQIFFIGNSYTFYNDMPSMVKNLAASLGMKMAPSRCLKGGQTLKGHLKHKFLTETLADGGFDYVVIQDASYTPSYSTREVLENVYPYAHRIDSLAKAGSPDVKTIYYMTWGHKDGLLHHQTDYPLDDTYQMMQDRLKTSYLEMAWENGGLCAPVGMAWERVVKERPDIELYSLKDRYHPSKEGSYLAACTILSTILGKPFESTYYANLPEDTARYLQKIAGETVADNLPLIGLKKGQ